MSCYITFNEAVVLRVWLHSGDVLRTEEEEEEEVRAGLSVLHACLSVALCDRCANQRHSSHTLLSYMPKKKYPPEFPNVSVKPTDVFSS